MNMWPCVMGMRRGGGRTVLDWIRVTIPITHKEIKGRIMKRVLRKEVKKLRTSSARGRSIEVGEGKGSTLVTECGR